MTRQSLILDDVTFGWVNVVRPQSGTFGLIKEDGWVSGYLIPFSEIVYPNTWTVYHRDCPAYWIGTPGEIWWCYL
jgi:hypothetical protein